MPHRTQSSNSAVIPMFSWSWRLLRFNVKIVHSRHLRRKWSVKVNLWSFPVRSEAHTATIAYLKKPMILACFVCTALNIHCTPVPIFSLKLVPGTVMTMPFSPNFTVYQYQIPSICQACRWQRTAKVKQWGTKTEERKAKKRKLGIYY